MRRHPGGIRPRIGVLDARAACPPCFPCEYRIQIANTVFQSGGHVTTMTTILGAGGPIGNELAKILAASNQPFRLVSRKPTPVAGAEVLAADLADREQCIQAVAGSRVVHLLVGLKYDLAVWRELWPRIMANTIEACKRAQAGLIFFDNVYMYGKANGPMTEK